MKRRHFFLAVLALFVIVSCSNDDTGSATSEAQNEPPGQITEQARELKPGPGLERTLDGSSKQSFEADMERIYEEVPDAQYELLTAALQTLLFHDVGARGDRARLYQRLDGLTGNEIIDRAKNIR